MADKKVRPILAAEGCQSNLPRWGVTREFRFGQFIQLYDERIVDGKRQVTPIRLNSNGDVTETADAERSSTATSVPRPASAVPLQALSASNVSEAATGEISTVIRLTNVEELVRTGVVELARGSRAQVQIAPEAAAELRAGRSVKTIAYEDGWRARVIRLSPTETETVRVQGLNEALATRQISTDDGVVYLDDLTLRNLMAVGEAWAPKWRDGTAGDLVRIEVAADRPPETRPAADKIQLDDIIEFIANPVIPAVDGSSLIVPLDATMIGKLRMGEAVDVAVGNRTVTLRPAALGFASGYARIGPARVIESAHPRHTLNGVYRDVILEAQRNSVKEQLAALEQQLTAVTWELRYADEDLDNPNIPNAEKDRIRKKVIELTKQRDELVIRIDELKKLEQTAPEEPASVEVPAPSEPLGRPRLSTKGLQVAILLPWRKKWTLQGFSRGNLLNSLALAPAEETRITVASWERRSKALLQTAETETEQSFDFTSTTRDTEDVFREMVQSNEFMAQAHASLDASYSNAVASIQLGADGSLQNTNSLTATARASTQHVRESVSRASTRVRARRVTTISESLEQTSMTETVRTIRNPSSCSTLTLNFHEVLAHYDVSLTFDKPAVRIVVLVPNPHHLTKFDGQSVRMNEAALRESLLDPALVDGFEACRTLRAYAAAKDELVLLATMAKNERESNRDRKVAAGPGASLKPENPHAATLRTQVRDLAEKYRPYKTADVTDAVNAIAGWKGPTPDQTTAANRWLWRRLVAVKLGNGLLDVLAGIDSAAASPEDARRIVAAMPSQGSFPALDGLNGLSDKDKEDAGLYAAATTSHSAAWWWWYPRLKDYGLYNIADGGIPGMLVQLQSTYQSWQAKESEGAGVQEAQAAIEQAKAEQQQATIADRLEMKFGVETVASAVERTEALLGHLNEHVDYYRYVLFQAMPPSEQLQRLMEVAPQLRIGMFEPHVVASDGPNLAVPLTPLAETTLAKFVGNIAQVLEKATKEAEEAGNQIPADQIILNTPGISVETWRGECSACDDHTEAIRAADVRLATARADAAELEVRRRKARLDAQPPLLDDPDPQTPPVLNVNGDRDELDA